MLGGRGDGVRPTFFDFKLFSKKQSYRPQLKVLEPLRQLIVYFITSATVGSSSGTDGFETADGATVDNGSWSVETDGSRCISVEFADDPVNEESSDMVEVPDESVFISDC